MAHRKRLFLALKRLALNLVATGLCTAIFVAKAAETRNQAIAQDQAIGHEKSGDGVFQSFDAALSRPPPGEHAS